MAYSSFRNELSPTQYPRDKTSVTVDYSLTAVISAFLLLYISFLVILPGFRGKQRIIVFARFTIFHLIGMAIIVSLFGQSWEVAWVYNAVMPYRAGVKGEIHANLGVHIGLSSVNITLKGVPETPEEGAGSGHRINYNERFYFSGPQGRIGFGQYYSCTKVGRVPNLSWSIFEVVYITAITSFSTMKNLVSIRYYNHKTAWCLWIIAVILSFLSIQVCSEILMLCGASMLCSNVLWALIGYGSKLVIPVASQQFLRFTFGWTCYLCLFAGILTFIFGVLVMVFNFLRPYETTLFFSFEDDEPTVKRVDENVVVPLCKADKGLSNRKAVIRVEKPLKVEDIVETMWESREKKTNKQNGTVPPRSATQQEY